MPINRRKQFFSISIEECHWLENLVFGFEKIVRTSGAYDPVDVDNRERARARDKNTKETNFVGRNTKKLIAAMRK